MADKEFKLGVEVTDAGTIKSVEEAVKKLRAELQGAAADSKKLSGALKGKGKEEGGTAGSRAIASGAGGAEIGGYGKQRGVAGETGAAARDFANQAQGLSGLVRLYAVYAANVFAVGMAFRGLSEAMDTTNMIKGLDQLGAASGRNLGGLSKRLMELTGNSISLREAMQAVAQTSSGGMSTKNIERLAVVARSASAALGVAMPDAISRLSRGITKLEPELLDELGIMTRLEPATQAYARELGKAVSQLTDFEKRQAFANAVLAEGEAKFGAITEISGNPYDKLISSLKNLTQVGATVINTVLAPIVELLSNSPNALTAALGVMAAMIIKQAVPAIGQVKEGLAASATAAAELAKQRAGDALKSSMDLNNLVAAESEKRSKVEIDSSITALEKLTELRGRKIKETSAAYKILEKDIKDITDAELARVDSKADRLFRKGLTEQAALYREITTSVRAQIDAEKERSAALARNEAIVRKEFTGSKTSIAGITQALAVEANTTAVKKAIISNAAYNAGLVGIIRAHVLMNAEIAKSGLALTGYQMIILKTQATLAGLAAVVNTVGTALVRLTNLFAWIGIATVLFSTLNGYLTSNAKEAAEASSALDEFKASAQNLSRTLDQLNRNMSQGTINGLNAMATAYENFTESFSKTISAIKKEKDAISGIWSVLGNEFSKINSSDVDSRMAEAIQESIMHSLELLDNTGLKEAARKKFAEILDVPVLNITNIKKAVANMSTATQAELVKFETTLSTALSNSASRVQSFKTATDASTRAYQQFIQAATNTGPMFKVGAALQNLGASMNELGKNAELGANEINAAMQLLVDIPDAGSVFGKDFVKGLVVLREEFNKQNTVINTYKRNLLDLDKIVQKTESLRARSPTELVNKKETVDKLKAQRDKVANEIGIMTEAQSKKARELFVDGMNTAFAKGADLIKVSLGQATERAANAVLKASVAGLSGENRAKAENQVAMKDLEIQLRAIDTNISLILSNELLKAAIDHSSAEVAHLAAIQSGRPEAEINAMANTKEAARIFFELLDKNMVPDFENALIHAGSELIAKQVAVKGIAASQKIAEQKESRVFVEGQMKAQGITGSINARSGKLEDDQKALALESQITSATQARAAAVQQIVTVSNVALVQQQTALERAILINKQESELAAINTAITNAQSQNEIDKQEGYKRLILTRQEQELEVLALTTAQKLLTVHNEVLLRNYELIRATNVEQFTAAQSNLDVLNAELSAYTQLYGIVAEYGASQTEVLGTQKAQLEYVKAISEAQLDFSAKEAKAKAQIAALSPTKDASRIAAINKELTRQNSLTKTTISNAKSTLVAQQKILEVNKKAAVQQARYNRLMDNSTSIANSLTEAFGEVGDSMGKMVISFAQMAINADKGAKALETIREKQKEAAGDTEKVNELEKDAALQRQKNVQMQLAGFAGVASAAKNMFDEQSAGYRALAAIEKVMFIAHIAFTMKQMAVDTMATIASLTNTETRIAGTVAEAEVNGVAAVIKALASVPAPYSFVLAAIMAAVVAGLLATIGGSSKKAPTAPRGINSKDMQETQGTGRRYVNGKLTDTKGGALGNSTEKTDDIALSLDFIEKNTALTSAYGIQTLKQLKAIETNTRALSAESFKTTNIGKLSSGFGTEEKQTSKKTVEIIDKGIRVAGSFADVLSGLAQYLEYEVVQTIKKKKGFLGIGKSKKIRITENSKDLEADAEEPIQELFKTFADMSISASKRLLGDASTAIQDTLNNFTVDFKVSGKDLNGEDFAAAISAESSVIMNQVIEAAMPGLNKFRKLGEGFSSTLIRMAATVDILQEKFTKFGLDIATSTIVENLSGYNDLIEALGGVDAFVEKADYLFENFYSEAEQNAIKTKMLIQTLKEFTDQGIITTDQFNVLTDGVGDTRLEYRELIAAQDALSESGQTAITVLTNLAPVVVEYLDSLGDSSEEAGKVVDKLGESISTMLESFDAGSFKSTLQDALLGKLESAEIGETIADMVKEGFYNAMSANFVEETTSLIASQLITPILTGIINLSTITAAAAASAIDSFVADIAAKTEVLAAIVSNPIFKRAMTTFTTALAQSLVKINNGSKELNFTFSNSKLQDYLTELKDLTAEIDASPIEDSIAAEETRLDILKQQADVLEGSSSTMRNFTNSLIEFKQSLLVGPESPLTPLQKYSTIRSKLDDLVQTILTTTDQDVKSAALDQIQEVASSFLEISRLVYASGSNYTNDFNYVQSILDTLISNTGTQATIDEQQLSVLKQQIAVSEDIIKTLNDQLKPANETATNTAETAARIAELQALIAGEYQRGKDNIAQSFSVLDQNLSGTLTFEELKASGLADDATLRKGMEALDTNGDNQISYLEALTGSSASISYSVQNMSPILEAINSGIISVDAGVDLLAKITAANATLGRPSITDNYVPNSGSGAGLINGQIAYTNTLGGYYQNGTVFGVNGQSASLDTVKLALIDYKQRVEAGEMTARAVYDILQSWGVDSAMVGAAFSVSKQSVLDWFKLYDPSIPAFAKGINVVPEDMIAQLHQGERVFPAADNRMLMQNISGNNTTNQELLEEIRLLNARIAQLEKAVIEGSVINAEATDRNTIEISRTVKDTASTTNHLETIRRKTEIA